MTLHERIQAARQAQQLYEQRHDVQLEIASPVPAWSGDAVWVDQEDDVDPSQISSGLMWDWPDTSYHADATKEDRA